ncbi:hypothetical protein KIW84_054571 [Lathyrus oleraceus]|nr:hypothetical protein KIW84_054571 [Pisum sativum]
MVISVSMRDEASLARSSPALLLSSCYLLWKQLKLKRYCSKSVVKYPQCGIRRQSTYADAEVTGSFAVEGEILDGIITSSRGEVKRICSENATSSIVTPSNEFASP